MPERIQRKRTKGWRMPPNTIYVGRGTRLGNPFRAVCTCETWSIVAADEVWAELPLTMRVRLRPEGLTTKASIAASAAVHCYEVWVQQQPWFAEEMDRIRGHNLACWCPLYMPCHADVLLRLANVEK